VVAVTDSDDFFGQLDEADPVTGDQTDSIQSSVTQCRYCGETHTRIDGLEGYPLITDNGTTSNLLRVGG